MNVEVPLIAYHNQPELKRQLLDMLRVHQELDHFAQFYGYWDVLGTGKQRGCAIGCSLESIRTINGLAWIDHESHELYEQYLGVPREIAFLEDRLFEWLPNDRAMRWPLEFAEAIDPGSDLSMVVPRFLHWVLSEPDGGVQRVVARDASIGSVVQRVIDLYEAWIDTGIAPGKSAWTDAANASAIVARAAGCRSASAAADAAAFAARAADSDAGSATAAFAARAATGAVDTGVLSSAYAANGGVEYIRQADKLLALLASAPQATGDMSASSTSMLTHGGVSI